MQGDTRNYYFASALLFTEGHSDKISMVSKRYLCSRINRTASIRGALMPLKLHQSSRFPIIRSTDTQ